MVHQPHFRSSKTALTNPHHLKARRVRRSDETYIHAGFGPLRTQPDGACQRPDGVAPHDLRTADATRAAEIYAGRFVFAGKIVTCHGRSIFDLEPPSEDWEVALLGFGWLRHLRAADTALTRANARALVDDWITNQIGRHPVSRRADVQARRVISLLSQAPLVQLHPCWPGHP